MSGRGFSIILAAALGACGSNQQPAASADAKQHPPPATSSRAEPDPTNRFASEAAGVSIEKLASWSFMPLDLELANRKAVSVGNAQTDAAMHESSTPPLVVIARYPEPSEKPNPTLKLNWRLLGDLKGAAPLEIARVVADLMKKTIPSFELDGDVHTVRLSGLEAGTFKAHFSLEVPHLDRSFPVTTEVWLVPRGNFGLIIAASDPTGGTEGYQADFEAMVATIKIWDVKK